MHDDRALHEWVHKVELAIGEVKVVERRANGVVLDRAVVNKDALLRARRAYRNAVAAVAERRITDGTATGRIPITRERQVVVQASTRLKYLERRLAELEGL